MKRILSILLTVFLLGSCSKSDQLIQDATRLKQVNQDFEKRKKSLPTLLHWEFEENNKLSPAVKQGLKFLYAYMPLNDFADYPPSFFQRNVEYALKARKEFAWGSQVPEAEFMHFVLPHRINNENLDSSRVVFFKELKNRLKQMSMREAALEVNHWCHEKVSYKGASIRTSAPLATVRSALGRCGEESTFTVQAMRSVGIPARQIYTPRWAHSDDNHAWVEVFVDGEWVFLGACEPNAKLNQGWFIEPGRRAMLTHTRAFGYYIGSEKIVQRTPYHTELNTLDRYAETTNLEVKVVDELGKPIENASVHFKLFNYAELFSLATLKTNAQGTVNFSSGLGDLFVWATDGKGYGFQKISMGAQKQILLTLKNTDLAGYSLDVDFIAPLEKQPLPSISTPEEDAQNQKRLKEEDAIRKNYEATFISEEQARSLAQELGLNEAHTVEALKKSRGNHATIKQFILSASKTHKDYVLPYLGVLSNKDLRDAPLEILLADFDHSFEYAEGLDKKLFKNYVLRPRIRNEFLSQYKKLFQSTFSPEQVGSFRKDPRQLVAHVATTIKLDEESMYYSLPMLPTGVHQMRRCNAESRNIYFVALCRAFGIPARLLRETTPQYYQNGWKEANFNAPVIQPKMATISFKTGTKGIDPKYYIDFTIARLENGVYQTIEYEWLTKISEFEKSLPIKAGSYMLVTGNRQKDGSVYSNLSFFEVKPNSHKTILVKIRQAKQENTVYGKIDLSQKLPNYNGEQVSLASTPNKNGMVLLWLEPDREPTKHLLRDLARLRRNFEQESYAILTITPKSLLTESFKPTQYDTPDGTQFLVTEDNQTLRKAYKTIGRDYATVKYPVVMCVNAKNEIIYVSQGYRIGLGDMIIKMLK